MQLPGQSIKLAYNALELLCYLGVFVFEVLVSICVVLVGVAEGINVLGRAVNDQVYVFFLFCRGERVTQLLRFFWRACDMHLFSIGPEYVS